MYNSCDTNRRSVNIHTQAIPNQSPAPTYTQRRRRDDPQDDDEDVDMEDEEPDNGSGSLEQLSKGLVRYALSCEFSRKPIKRQDINEKGRLTQTTISTSADN